MSSANQHPPSSHSHNYLLRSEKEAVRLAITVEQTAQIQPRRYVEYLREKGIH